MADYPAPVDQLLTRGDPGTYGHEWPDYRTLGLGPEHVPDLIRMATDPALNQGDPESTEVWAPLHAWRALGQLRAETAVGPLLEQLRRAQEQDDDWGLDEIPQILAMIGPPALPTLAAFLADPAHGVYARGAVARAVAEMAAHFPEMESEGVGILTRQLERATENDPELNGFIISELMDLGAVESASVMERAFDAGAVDESIPGDWDQVQWELGLSDEPPPEDDFGWRPGFSRPPDEFEGDVPRPPGYKAKKAKAKAKRKQAAKSRKRNRKRK